MKNDHHNALILILREVLELEYAIRRIERTETFTGRNYFYVTKTSITAMVSTTITYLVVLLQTPNNSTN
jgi:Trehalose receptor